MESKALEGLFFKGLRIRTSVRILRTGAVGGMSECFKHNTFTFVSKISMAKAHYIFNKKHQEMVHCPLYCCVFMPAKQTLSDVLH